MPGKSKWLEVKGLKINELNKWLDGESGTVVSDYCKRLLMLKFTVWPHIFIRH